MALGGYAVFPSVERVFAVARVAECRPERVDAEARVGRVEAGAADIGYVQRLRAGQGHVEELLRTTWIPGRVPTDLRYGRGVRSEYRDRLDCHIADTGLAEPLRGDLVAPQEGRGGKGAGGGVVVAHADGDLIGVKYPLERRLVAAA